MRPAAIGAVVNRARSVDPTENVCTFGGKAIADMVNFVEIPGRPGRIHADARGNPQRIRADAGFRPGRRRLLREELSPEQQRHEHDSLRQQGRTIVRIDVVHHGASDSD